MSSSFQAGHALLIGAGADLPFTIDDARGIADILKDPERCAYPAGQVELLVGETAHRQAVLDALDRLAERADESSTVIIYFSGHGYHASTPISEAYFLIPFGVQMERLKDTAISGSEFAARLQAIRSKKLLLLLDCCHAGGVGLAKGLELAKSSLPPEALEIFKQGKGRVIIASCKDSELSYGGKPFSAFTLALIEAFSGQGASKQDGFVRAADLAMHAREKVPGRTNGRQHPILHFEEADNFLLAYYAGGETEPKGLPFAEQPEIEPEPGAWSDVFDQRGQTVYGPQTNNVCNVQGSLLSGQFSGPVAMGGEAIDMRGSTGATYKPTYNIPKAEEIPSIPTIPDPPPDFTGRDDELKELQAKFASGTNIIGLRSNGGVGKTALSLKLGESLKDRYPDGQVMVDMRGTSDNPLSPSEAMGSVIHAYHPKEEIPDNEAEIKEMYRRVLNGKRALLLLDNVLDDKQVLKLIPPKSCGLLVTSRKTIKLPGLFRKDLYVLKPEEALELLLKVWCSTSCSAESPKADPSWSEIARLCVFLPLALRAAASLLANTPDLSPANYAEELKDERTRLERIGMEGVELSVDASFNLSLQRLDTKTQQTFLIASIFPADFDGKAEEQICQDEGHKRLTELVRWSLVEYQRPSQEGEGRYHLHDLVRLFAAGRLEEEGGEAARNDAQKRHAEYFRDVLYSATKLYKNGEALAGLRRFDLEMMNIESAWAWVKRNLTGNNTAASICNSFLNWPYLLELRMHPRELISWLETALAAARQLKDKRKEGIHLGNLGSAYHNLADARKAIEYYERALAIATEIEDKRNEGAWLGNLGNAETVRKKLAQWQGDDSQK
ncbi:MAG: caspase family protein [Methanothrix sp.]|nr:caspase family protein [Methanothrix sp.]